MSAATTSALAFDADGIYVTARVPTTAVDDVRLGSPVSLIPAADQRCARA